VGDSMRRDEIQNLLKSQNLETVAPSAFKQVGNPIFPDQSATDGMATVREIVDTFRSVHLPAYGGIIPSSGATVTTTGDSGTLLSLSGNEVARVFIVELGSTILPESVDILVGGSVYVNAETNPTKPVNALQNTQTLYIDSKTPLTYTAVSASQMVSVVYQLISQ